MYSSSEHRCVWRTWEKKNKWTNGRTDRRNDAWMKVCMNEWMNELRVIGVKVKIRTMVIVKQFKSDRQRLRQNFTQIKTDCSRSSLPRHTWISYTMKGQETCDNYDRNTERTDEEITPVNQHSNFRLLMSNVTVFDLKRCVALWIFPKCWTVYYPKIHNYIHPAVPKHVISQTRSQTTAAISCLSASATSIQLLSYYATFDLMNVHLLQSRHKESHGYSSVINLKTIGYFNSYTSTDKYGFNLEVGATLKYTCSCIATEVHVM